uniref:Stimulator of interferon genes protein n=1 Tax=Nothobranchius furzeri TaxID=105023 RepID=A0A8C6K9S5_NOTFU
VCFVFGNQDALIPRPRGELPKLCAAGLVALATMGVVVSSPDSFLGMVALAALMVTLGPLLHGLCLLAEELRHHSNTRYRACRHMLPACGLWGKTLLAAGLAGLFLYLTKQLLPPRDQCWELLVLVPAVYALLKSLGVMGPSEVEVSGICEGRKMNVAHGLAWSFYLGYLQLVLPRLENSIAAFCAAHHRSTPLWSRGSRKLLILVPLSANISHKLEDEDDNISFLENLPNNEIDRAGVRGRVYKHSVYRVKDGQGAGFCCVVELIMLTLSFYYLRRDILSPGLCLFFHLPDEHEDDPHFLSKAILRHLDQQEREEFSPSAGGYQPRPEPMSREPTLMISLEKPQSLQVPVENTDIHHRGT